jgi:hypothetical protein
MSLMKLYWVIISAFIVLTTDITAQSVPHYLFTIKEGLPSNYVYRTLEDSKGYIWVITEGGVCRFNGQDFKCFTAKEGTPANDIYKLIEDGFGRIWLMNVNQQLSYIRDDKVVVLDVESSYYIKYLYYDEENVIFINKNHLFIIGKGDQIKKIKFDALDDYSEYEQILARKLYKYKSSIHWVFGDTNWFIYTPIFLGHIVKYDVSTEKEDYYYLPNPENRTGLSKVIGQFHKPSNEIQISYDSDLEILNKDLSFKSRIDLSQFASFNINTAMQDNNENLWISTAKGLVFISQAILGSKLKIIDGTEKMIINKLIYYDDVLYFANESGEVYNYIHDEIHLVGKADLINPSATCYKIECNEDYIYASYRNTGIHAFNKLKNKLTTYSSPLNYYNDNVWRNAKDFEFFNDSIYICSKYKLGISEQLVATGKYKNAGALNQIELDPHSKNVWYATSKELYKNSIANFLNITDLKPVAKISEIEHIKHIGQQKVLITTSYDKAYLSNIDTTILLNKLNGIDINTLAIVDDKIWFNTSKGLFSCAINEIETNNALTQILRYNRFLSLNDVKDFAVNDSIIYLCTEDGLIKIQDYQNISNPTELPFYIKTINDKPFTIGSNIEIVHHDGLNISYEGVSKEPESNINYNYQLEGIDNQIQSTSERNLRFHDLKHGEYTFHINASDKYGNKSKTFTLPIKVLKPFWLTTWFILALLLALFLSIYWFTKYLINNERRKAKILQKYAELEIDALQSQMNPHFVFNALSSLQYLVNNNDIKKADKYISKFSTLLRQYLEASKNKLISIKDEIDIINNYLSIEAIRFENKINYKIVNNLVTLSQERLIPAAIIQPFVENAIIHGLLQSDQSGELIISLNKKNGYIEITIDDNGIGTVESKRNKKPTKRISRGLEIINSKIDVIKKLHMIDINYKIQDKSIESNGEKKGTLVIFKIGSN